MFELYKWIKNALVSLIFSDQRRQIGGGEIVRIGDAKSRILQVRFQSGKWESGRNSRGL